MTSLVALGALLGGSLAFFGWSALRAGALADERVEAVLRARRAKRAPEPTVVGRTGNNGAPTRASPGGVEALRCPSCGTPVLVDNEALWVLLGDLVVDDDDEPPPLGGGTVWKRAPRSC
jgi:hypothetical protein